MSADLVAFLRARLDEDEATARAATQGGWEAVVTYYGATVAGGGRYIAKGIDRGHDPDSNADHIARHDPARVLREVESKRRIIDAAEDASGIDAQLDGDRRVGPRDEATEPYVGDVILRALALPYADHPDYREEWKP